MIKKQAQTLDTLEEWDLVVRSNEESFFKNLFQYEDAILLDVYFNYSVVKCTFLVPSGETWTDAKPLEEFLDWMKTLDQPLA